MTQPMGIDLGALARMYQPLPLAVKELNLGNAWRAIWAEAEELPPNAPVAYAYAVAVSGDKGYVTRPAGSKRWKTIEGALRAGETGDDFVKRAAAEQAGILTSRVTLIGFYECRATSTNPDFPKGMITVRPIYLVEATKLQEMGNEALFERRRMPLNEHASVLREAYPELHDSITKTVDHYLVARARAGA